MGTGTGRRRGEEEEGIWSGSGVERQIREVERGRGRGGGAAVEREDREVERGRGRRGESGNSIMGCRTSTEDRRVDGRSMLKDRKGEGGKKESRERKIQEGYRYGGGQREGNTYRQRGIDTDAKWK